MNGKISQLLSEMVATKLKMMFYYVCFLSEAGGFPFSLKKVRSRDLVMLCKSIRIKRTVVVSWGSYPAEHFEKPPRIPWLVGLKHHKYLGLLGSLLSQRKPHKPMTPLRSVSSAKEAKTFRQDSSRKKHLSLLIQVEFQINSGANGSRTDPLLESQTRSCEPLNGLQEEGKLS